MRNKRFGQTDNQQGFSRGGFGSGSGAGGSSFDSDAQAYMTAAGISDNTQKTAWNNFVVGSKADNYWSKLILVAPLLGGTAGSHAVNAKSPGTFNLTFTGGVTHSATGVGVSGTTGYINTNLTPSISLTNNDTHWSFYSRTNSAQDGWDFGAYAPGASSYAQMSAKLSSGNFLSDAYDASGRVITANSDSRGFYLDVATSVTSLHKAFKNGTQIGASGVLSGTVTNIVVPLTFGALNNNGAIQNFSNREFGFLSIGTGLTDTEAANLSARVLTLMTALGRNV